MKSLKMYIFSKKGVENRFDMFVLIVSTKMRCCFLKLISNMILKELLAFKLHFDDNMKSETLIDLLLFLKFIDKKKNNNLI